MDLEEASNLQVSKEFVNFKFYPLKFKSFHFKWIHSPSEIEVEVEVEEEVKFKNIIYFFIFFNPEFYITG